MAGRNLLLHEDNHVVRRTLTCMASRSLVMMQELRCLWCLLDTNSINLCFRYVSSEAIKPTSCLGRKAQPTPRQRRLEAMPNYICGARLAVRTMLDRPIRIITQLVASTIQRRMPRPDLRRGGLSTLQRRGMPQRE
jgi:hypothetical protein